MMNEAIKFEDVLAYLNKAASMGQLDRGKRQQIVGALRYAQENEQDSARDTLAVGMKVTFPAKRGGMITGTVHRILPKNVEVRADGAGPFAPKWRCSPGILKVVG